MHTDTPTEMHTTTQIQNYGSTICSHTDTNRESERRRLGLRSAGRRGKRAAARPCPQSGGQRPSRGRRRQVASVDAQALRHLGVWGSGGRRKLQPDERKRRQADGSKSAAFRAEKTKVEKLSNHQGCIIYYPIDLENRSLSPVWHTQMPPGLWFGGQVYQPSPFLYTAQR